MEQLLSEMHDRMPMEMDRVIESPLAEIWLTFDEICVLGYK